ncbi:restriction endonuclease [Halosolutus amylolyticus]|uniref:Restriction endonuclease n=1 Tax=Halosolutus amylolyticus TaxID=2932267 RepID=A0ABD5PNJ5_9EURY|nr:restriction endonuclease [Halosolutus amylolyticus]
MDKHETIREDLFEIDTDEFDKFVTDLWEYRGYDIEDPDARRATFKATKGGGFLRSGTTELVQPLYREGYKVDKSDVNRVLDLRFGDDIDELVVVTTTEFTEGARKQGKRPDVRVISGEELADLIIEENAEKVLDRYLPKGSVLKGLFWLFVILPLKIMWALIVFPLKLLFGSNSEKQSES